MHSQGGWRDICPHTYLDNHCHVLYSPCLVVSGILVCVPQWTGVATHGPAPEEEPRTAASQAPAGDTGPWAAHGHCRTWMENDVAQYTEKVPTY